MMRTLQILFLSTMLLTACNNKPSAAADDDMEDTTSVVAVSQEVEVKPEYNSVDALAFGLKGKVQSVLTQYISTYEENGELKEEEVNYTKDITFDSWGHVTQDEWGNKHLYDMDGAFYRGNHTYTIVKRDKSGRLVQYVDEEPDTDSEDNQTFTLTYDKNGRIVTVERGGWTGFWTETRHYEGNNLYPSKVETTSSYEGGGEGVYTETYQYSCFDQQGNWTERVCVASSVETDDDFDSESGESTQIKETITIEKRVIDYYDE